MKIEDCFYIGYITKTKGLKGEVQVFFEYDDPADLNFKTVFIEISGKLVPFFTSKYKIHENQTGNFYFDDLDTIEKAQAIVRKKVYVPNSEKPEKDPDDFSFFDLKGFIVQDEHHGELGEIIEINEYPQQFIATVHYKFRDVLFPLNDHIIQSIDEEQEIVYISLPDGLLGVYLDQ